MDICECCLLGCILQTVIHVHKGHQPGSPHSVQHTALLRRHLVTGTCRGRQPETTHTCMWLCAIDAQLRCTAMTGETSQQPGCSTPAWVQDSRPMHLQGTVCLTCSPLLVPRQALGNGQCRHIAGMTYHTCQLGCDIGSTARNHTRYRKPTADSEEAHGDGMRGCYTSSTGGITRHADVARETLLRVFQCILTCLPPCCSQGQLAPRCHVSHIHSTGTDQMQSRVWCRTTCPGTPSWQQT